MCGPWVRIGVVQVNNQVSSNPQRTLWDLLHLLCIVVLTAQRSAGDVLWCNCCDPEDQDSGMPKRESERKRENSKAENQMFFLDSLGQFACIHIGHVHFRRTTFSAILNFLATVLAQLSQNVEGVNV